MTAVPSRFARDSFADLRCKRHQVELGRPSADRRPSFRQPFRNQDERDSKRDQENGDQSSRHPGPVRLPNEVAPEKKGYRHQDKRADELLPVNAGHGTSSPYSTAVSGLAEKHNSHADPAKSLRVMQE